LEVKIHDLAKQTNPQTAMRRQPNAAVPQGPAWPQQCAFSPPRSAPMPAKNTICLWMPMKKIDIATIEAALRG